MGGTDSSSVWLVRRALNESAFWKEAGRVLALEMPCVEAAGILLSSNRADGAPAHVVAYLLGELGHDVGYESVPGTVALRRANFDDPVR